MHQVLTAIAKQANLERVLFTPSLKKLYFDMAVGSGGATQFKHAESIRAALNYAAEKAADKKRALVFCAAHELAYGYDLMLKLAAEFAPVAMLTVRGGVRAPSEENGSLSAFRECGWAQFYTHTMQELYDHLAIAYWMAEREIHLPTLIVHSSLNSKEGEFAPREELNLGDPLRGLQSGRKKIDFEAALAAVGKKKEKPTLRGAFSKFSEALSEIYGQLGYSVESNGLPFAGTAGAGKSAVVTLVPPANARDGWLRLLSYRPYDFRALSVALSEKQTIAVVEPVPAPGGGAPPYYAELAASLREHGKARVISVTIPREIDLITAPQAESLEALVSSAEPGTNYFSHSLD